MNFFLPTTQLIRRTVIDGPNTYYLRTLTYCDQFNYLVDANYSTSAEVDENGNFEVNINIIQDNDLPSNESIMPLIHQIDLGALSSSEVMITINLTTENKQDPASAKQKKGTIIISTVAAEEESRPIKMGKL